MNLNAAALFLLSIGLLACSERSQADPAPEVDAPAAVAENKQALPFSQRRPVLTFDHDVSAILGEEDDYIRSYSAFDYAAKFKSDTPLDAKQREAAYKKALQPFTPAETQRLQNAFNITFDSMKGMTVLLPETIHIFSEQAIETGAAYTRANTICMPKVFIANLDDEALAIIAAHELFHVISRYNKGLRPEIYGILGFQAAAAPKLPEPLASLTIANPDAPGMDYVIECGLNGEKRLFLPILYARGKYKGGSFFSYLSDDLLAVTIEDKQTQVVMENGKPLIVKKAQVQGYFEKVGTNTRYNFHPEETSADHFALLLYADLKRLPNPDKVSALGKILRK